ncbi:hD domain-containing protein [Clostridium sp. CAG:1024]|nr:HD domain-containing protein [Clostridium sp.]MDD7139424.1 HD domain-containing protein [Clostridium sp.]MDO4342969.1 HD domain-containing protein [Eubacteriales bacterium]MDY6081721.1 HD domain-containing protein [Eubacteriales bacterium]CCX41510.1 hD domain-containing protein [Clostridium sp. CAG:1024]
MTAVKCSPVQAQALDFLRERFLSSDAMDAAARSYRFRHTLRVAELGRRIARAEGLSEDALVVGCLLHDLAYSEVMPDEAAWRGHGRRSAALARPFVETLALPDADREALLFGIAIHVDDVSGFPGERSPLACSIGDCDNLDRFDVYRVYEQLERVGFSTLDADAQRAFVAKAQAHLRHCENAPVSTATARALWQDRLAFQNEFYRRLSAQLALETPFSVSL